MRSKRIVLGAGVVLIFLICLTGCGKRKAEEQQVGREKEILRMVGLNVGKTVLEEAVREFNEGNDQVEIACEYYDMEEYKSALARKMAVNEEPDMFFAWQSGFLEAYVNRDKVLALDEFMDAEPKWQEWFTKQDLTDVSFGGSIYGIPSTKCITLAFYNKDLFQKYGVEIPRTYEDFQEVCRTFKDNGVTPLYLNSIPWVAGQMFLQVLIGSCGQEMISSQSLEEIPWGSDKFQSAAQQLADWYRKGYIPEDFLGMEGEQVEVQDTAIYITGNWLAKMMDESWGAFLIPSEDDENEGIAIGGNDRCYAISKTCGNPEEAFAFLELLSSEKYRRKLLTEEGMIPAGKLDVEEAGLTELERRCYELMQGTKQFCLNMDVRFGPEFGDLFNESAQAIIAGEDCGEVLKNLEQFGKQETEEE